MISSSAIITVLRSTPVIPVLTIDHADQALPLAEALLSGGLTVLEITLRTPSALGAISAIRKQFPAANVGAGTVLNKSDYDQAVAAGATFIVSPGFTPELLACAAGSSVPLLPGVNTPSEIMQLLAAGLTAMKFFPAEAAGGVAMLKALQAPLPQALFCPTGGIGLQNAPDYLALPNVACIGGSWMVPKDLLSAGRWSEIRTLAAQAAALRN